MRPARGGHRLEPATRLGGAGLLALAVTYGVGRQAFGLFVPAFQEDFGPSLGTLGLVASAAQAGYLAVVVVTGLMAARVGARVPVVAGCLVLSVGAALVADAPFRFNEVRIRTRIEREERPGVVPARTAGSAFVEVMTGDARSELILYPTA